MNKECDHVASENSLSDTTTQEQDMSIVDSGIGGSVLTTQKEDMLNSGCESRLTGSFPSKFGLLGDEYLIRLEEEDSNYMHFKQVFLAGMGDLRDRTIVEAVYSNSHSSLLGKARVQGFQIYLDAMLEKCGVSANVEYAWYASSEDGICGILRYGFGQCDNPDNGGLYGRGLYLTPVGSSIDSAMSSVADENGLRHLLLCRVILGNQEEVLPGSKQLLPSSEEFDSGVDNCLAPKKYIIWSAHMNTLVLPEYIISFRNPSLPRVCQRIAEPVRRPSSPWVPLARLVSIISRRLPPPSVHLITRYYADFMAKKITRITLIRRLRQIAGDRLLLAIIKSYGSKVPKEEVH
ncbi:putative inactive poly ADP-ribose polymerase SRO2 [Cinnamomum micranthum f. kanehirae]|uniref:Putative inactive poly ADP-ribose polymerase SRO2 n=1 Tax=Cinnamomum micranthum f. kanehirae TaxID=337451 RepID=A0A443N374_9MAGN|nr:putative inactive poly ADP-ribose polymerase SRO2 [Cinnamomum micranthum f. kanehirae]